MARSHSKSANPKRFLKSAQWLWSYHKRKFGGGGNPKGPDFFLKKMRNDLLCAKEMIKTGVSFFFPQDTKMSITSQLVTLPKIRRQIWNPTAILHLKRTLCSFPGFCIPLVWVMMSGLGLRYGIWVQVFKELWVFSANRFGGCQKPWVITD